MSNIPLVKK